MGTQAKDQRFNATASNPPDRVSLAEHLLRYRRAQAKQHCMTCPRPGEARVVRISGTRFRQSRSRSHGSFGLADELEHHMDSRIRAVYIRRHTYVLAFHPPPDGPKCDSKWQSVVGRLHTKRAISVDEAPAGLRRRWRWTELLSSKSPP